MANFVGQHVGLRKLAGRAELSAQFFKEAQVDVDLLVLRTVKRSRGGFRLAARGPDGIPVEVQLGMPVLHSLFWQQFLPSLLHIAKDVYH